LMTLRMVGAAVDLEQLALADRVRRPSPASF
jgi:hypothetical protein